jgi:hypothetical protein
MLFAMQVVCLWTAFPLALAAVAPAAHAANLTVFVHGPILKEVESHAQANASVVDTVLAVSNTSARVTPAAKNRSISANVSDNSSATEDTEIVALRAKLTKIGGALSKAFVNEGALSKTKVADAVRLFIVELGRTLNETAVVSNATQAVRRLRESVQVVHALSQELTMQQVQLMRKGEEEEQNLLLGVLMTREHQSMSKQFEVLRNPEFANLPVVGAVLKANDTSVPLFQQVAAYLDHQEARNDTKQATVAPKSLRGAKDVRKPDVRPIVAALERQLQHLEANEKLQSKQHAAEMKELDAAAERKEKTSSKAAHHIRMLKKEENRKHAKLDALHRHDIETLRAAIVAIEQGDMTALLRAKNALQESLRAVQAQSGGFLYLIQTLHRTEGRDCPYCAAQCIDKCHTAGKPYSVCLLDCADAGK